jgi:hypothetical protein
MDYDELVDDIVKQVHAAMTTMLNIESLMA